MSGRDTGVRSCDKCQNAKLDTVYSAATRSLPCCNFKDAVEHTAQLRCYSPRMVIA